MSNKAWRIVALLFIVVPIIICIIISFIITYFPTSDTIHIATRINDF